MVALRVLLCGEGDFSFAAAYLRAWRHYRSAHPSTTRTSACSRAAAQQLRLVATSLDSEEEVLRRYGPVGVAGNLAAVRALGGRVLHGVDATNLADPAGPLLSEMYSDCCGSIHSTQTHELFDVVQFQFPHTGDKHRIQVCMSEFGG